MNKRIPMRTCVGCKAVKPQKELIRIVDGSDGLVIDPDGKKNGRGVYVCPETKCIYDAIKNNGFKRSLKRNIEKETIDKLAEELKEYGQENG